MCLHKNVKQCLSSIKLFLATSLLNIFEPVRFVFTHWFRFGSERNFILRIAPLRNKAHDSYRNYYPPPYYGTPLGKLSDEVGADREEYAKYGLFLWPDRLYKEVDRYAFLLLCTSIPFIALLFIGCKYEAWLYVGIIFSFLSAIGIKFYFILFLRSSPPVLSRVWHLWPESQFERFLTVPHLSELAVGDQKKTKETAYNKYWKPDEETPLTHQTFHYAKGKNTLQEVILHLAVFDFLFYPRGAEREEENSLKMKGWLYLLSPAILAYTGLFFVFFVEFIFYSLAGVEQNSALILPFFYVPIILIWSVMTFLMIMKQIKFLEKLQKNVREGYYNTHLKMVPQQILSAISAIPKDEQISDGLKQIKEILKFVQAGALVTFLIVLEIFSNG